MTSLVALALVGAALVGAPQEAAQVAQTSAVELVPENIEEIREVLGRAVTWLVDNQQPDGSWGTHHSPRPIEVLASVPGSQTAFKVATTALTVSALQECAVAGDAGRSAVERGLDFLLETYDVKRMSGLEHYNVWSFGYALQCFGERLLSHPEGPRAKQIRKACRRLVEKLGMYQTLDGGWGYLSISGVPTFQPSDTSMSFTTATIMVGMAHVRSAGIELPEKLVARAVDHLKRSRLPDGAFLYGEYLKYRPRMGINEIKGSACRNPLCHHALELFGESPPKPDTMVESLRDLIIRHASLQRAALRRPIPHESWYSISGYFYLYGYAYAAIALRKLPAAEQVGLWPALVKAVRVCEQPDGSFWDYPLYSYHKPYGTAFAVQALSHVPGIDAQD
ncbi:MAG: hypothetical protein ACI8QZ_000226 [Chlamydiales bacterium]|jgi:hypothetical protein